MNRRATTFIRQMGGFIPPVFNTTYGRLYNWFSVDDGRMLAPVNCHIPDSSEIDTLTTYLGGTTVAGGKLKEAGLAHWLTPNTGATNSSYFTALPSGNRRGVVSGIFSSLGSVNFEWSTTSSGTSNAIYFRMDYDNASRVSGAIDKNYGFCVRCICDTTDSTITDIDGNVYDTIVIGTQRWLVQNLKVTKYRNGDDIPNVTDSATWIGLTDGAMCAYNNDEGNV